MNQSVLQLQIKILQLKVLIAKAQFHIPMTKMEQLYTAAVAKLGTDVSPRDLADNSVACAESVNALWKSVMGEYISPQNILSTMEMYKQLNFYWKKVTVPTPGAIIISPTESATKIGHVGVCGLGDTIMANDSRSGLWLETYTQKSWHMYFEKKLGLKVALFIKE